MISSQLLYGLYYVVSRIKIITNFRFIYGITSYLQVASAVGRAEVLSCIFFLLAVLTYLRAISEGRGRTIKSLTRIKIHLVILTIVFSACAMLSKEQGVTAIGVCAGYDCLLNWKVLQSIAKKGAPPIQRGSHPFPLANSVSDKDEGEKIMSKKLTGRSNGSGGKGRSRSSRGTGGHEQEMLHCSVIWRLGMHIPCTEHVHSLDAAI